MTQGGIKNLEMPFTRGGVESGLSKACLGLTKGLAIRLEAGIHVTNCATLVFDVTVWK